MIFIFFAQIKPENKMENEAKRIISATPEEIENGKMMAFLAYLSLTVGFPLFVLPLVMEDLKKNKFTMFHVEQAIICYIVFIAGFIIGFVGSFFCIGAIFFLVPLAAWIFSILGIVNAFNGKLVALPVIGQFGEKLNLVK